jgi:hypothetical protein
MSQDSTPADKLQTMINSLTEDPSVHTTNPDDDLVHHAERIIELALRIAAPSASYSDFLKILSVYGWSRWNIGWSLGYKSGKEAPRA